MFVVYVGVNEVLVTTKKRESRVIKEWFNDSDRIISEYGRRELSEDAVSVNTHFSAW